VETKSETIKNRNLCYLFGLQRSTGALVRSNFTACVVEYAFSPIDLIPDPIPILGCFDDLILILLGVVITLRMIPDKVMTECRGRSQEIMRQSKPVNWIAAIVIIAIWISFAVIVIGFIE
jgi:uncharacterized membrane protein YkvA (DUF1232 family)